MKFYTTMFKKQSASLIVLFIVLTFSSHAQKGTQSPYSVFGIGELNMGQYASFSSMGGISIACTDSTIANHNNPASYAYFNRNRPVFQMGMNGRFSNFESANASSSQSTFGLNQFQLGLPIKKNWGASFGLVPYSFTGYTILNYDIDIDGDTTSQTISEGTGAISKVFLGVAFKAIDHMKLDTNVTKKDTSYTFKSHKLSLGVHGNYLFGNSAKTQSFEYLTYNLSFNARVRNALRISDASADFGINYQYYFRPAYTDSLNNGSVSIGATYSPGFKLRAYQDLISYTYLGSFYNSNNGIDVFDTVEHILDNEGLIYIPEQYRLGIEYRFGWKPSSKGERQLRLGLEANYQKWTSYYEDFGSPTASPFRDRLSLGFGLEYSPVIGNDPTINILSRTNYRLGFNYTQTELSINGTNLDNYGMSFGLGIPLNINSTNTSINLGTSLGSMGTTENGLIREKYISVFFGISIIPDRNDAWFVKRKYD